MTLGLSADARRARDVQGQDRARAAHEILRMLRMLAALALLGGCASGTQAPIEQKSAAASPPVSAAEQRVTRPPQPVERDKPGDHLVVRGDTVHAIAFRYRIDYRDLVRWNALSNPDRIYIGQRLRLVAPPATARTTPPPPARSAPAAPAPAPARELAVTRAPARSAAPAVAVHGPLRWTWPTAGKARMATSVSGTKGLEIRGQRGQSVTAAAAGSVVYSGSGLRGYGELIILKHNETFLSAYAHNEVRLVQEGDRVDTGQAIARMGNTDAKDVMLHFEIRRNGKAVDPLQFLPKR